MDELPLSKKVVQVAVGLKHTLALTEDQEVYSWGKGPALGHFDLFESKPFVTMATNNL
jgi:alpha-tubulin suppressor-like RCC1 family protein